MNRQQRKARIKRIRAMQKEQKRSVLSMTPIASALSEVMNKISGYELPKSLLESFRKAEQSFLEVSSRLREISSLNLSRINEAAANADAQLNELSEPGINAQEFFRDALHQFGSRAGAVTQMLIEARRIEQNLQARSLSRISLATGMTAPHLESTARRVAERLQVNYPLLLQELEQFACRYGKLPRFLYVFDGLPSIDGPPSPSEQQALIRLMQRRSLLGSEGFLSELFRADIMEEERKRRSPYPYQVAASAGEIGEIGPNARLRDARFRFEHASVVRPSDTFGSPCSTKSCMQCSFYSGSPYLKCAVNPMGSASTCTHYEQK